MALFGSVAALRAQAPQTRGFLAAFAYVEEALQAGSPADTRLRALARGASNKVELEAGAFAIEQVYDTKARADGFFESHLKYIDVQVVVAGDERMEVIDAARIQVKEPYNPERDLVTYQDATDASCLLLAPGQAAIFYPTDVHMPSLQTGMGPTLVRKTVVKVPIA